MCFAAEDLAALRCRRTHLRLMLSPTNPSEGMLSVPSASRVSCFGVIFLCLGAERAGGYQRASGVMPSNCCPANESIRYRFDGHLNTCCASVAEPAACGSARTKRSRTALQMSSSLAEFPGHPPSVAAAGRNMAATRHAPARDRFSTTLRNAIALHGKASNLCGASACALDATAKFLSNSAGVMAVNDRLIVCASGVSRRSDWRQGSGDRRVHRVEKLQHYGTVGLHVALHLRAHLTLAPILKLGEPAVGNSASSSTCSRLRPKLWCVARLRMEASCGSPSRAAALTTPAVLRVRRGGAPGGGNCGDCPEGQTLDIHLSSMAGASSSWRSVLLASSRKGKNRTDA